MKGPAGVPCPGTPVVRYAVGTVCSAHLLPGAEVYEWLVDPAALAARGGQVDDALRLLAVDAAADRLPAPSRPGAAAHAGAAAGEAGAARLVAYRAGTIRGHVLAHLIEVGPRGTTAIEAWDWYRATHSPTTERYSVAPRLSELVADGWAVKTGGTRNVRGAGYPPEEVYVLSARGRREKGLTW
ncbi:hypothetical protein [Blastococcus xanthinilyticus]|uniref:hypothetical protein n=1 Tax=Blastococcus xanthinilyticus TaxID=1564164 RepID=UPI0014132560|nr:hypothetical protein [Blastococcus xanthinilyticus]